MTRTCLRGPQLACTVIIDKCKAYQTQRGIKYQDLSITLLKEHFINLCHRHSQGMLVPTGNGLGAYVSNNLPVLGIDHPHRSSETDP